MSTKEDQKGTHCYKNPLMIINLGIVLYASPILCQAHNVRLQWKLSPGLTHILPPFLLLFWPNPLNSTPARHVCTLILLSPESGYWNWSAARGLHKEEGKKRKPPVGKLGEIDEVAWAAATASRWPRSMAIKLLALASQRPPDRWTLMQMKQS